MSATPAALAVPRRRRRVLSGDPWPGLLLTIVVATSFVILALLVVVVGLSFRTGTPGDPQAAWTFANYPSIFLDSATYDVLANTLGFACITTLIALVFGVGIAWLVERTDLPGKAAIFTLMAIGLLFPGFAAAMGWLFLLNDRIGLVNVWLRHAFGLATSPLNIATVTGMGWVQGLNLAPLAFVMTAAVLRAADPTLEESAQIAGASMRSTLWRVTLPLAWPGVLAAAIYIFMIGFSAFDVSAIIGWSSRIYTISTYLVVLLTPSLGLPRYGVAAALSVLLIAFAGAFSLFYRRMQGRAHRYQVVTGKAYRPRPLALGRATVPCWIGVGLYFCLAKLVPFVMLIWASLLPYFQLPSHAAFASLSLARYHHLPWRLIGDGLGNTAVLMVLTPTATLVLSLCFSWIVLRSRVRRRGWFDVIAFLPHAVPSIIFGVGALLVTLFVLARFLPLWGTVWLLLMLFTIARISYGTRMTNSGLIQVHRELEESAQVSGASTMGVMRAIITPLLMPTMLYAWLWIALLTFRELTLPVLLTTHDNITLPVVIWSLWFGGGLGDAAAASLIMLALMLPIVALYCFVARRYGLKVTG